MHRRGQIRKRSLPLSIVGVADAEAETDIVAAAPVGSLTSVEEDMALARLRVDRLEKALADGLPLTVNETPVTIDIPAWLQAEREAMATS